MGNHSTMDEKTKRKKCNHFSASYSLESSTATLVRHIGKQHPRILHLKSTSVVLQCFQPQALGDKKTQNLNRAEESKIDDNLDRWIIASPQAFSGVHLLEFQKFVEALNPSYNFCSRNSLKARILADYDLPKAYVIKVLINVSPTSCGCRDPPR